jgi:hypothetical protein
MNLPVTTDCIENKIHATRKRFFLDNATWSDFFLQICGFGAKAGLHFFSIVIVRFSIF